MTDHLLAIWAALHDPDSTRKRKAAAAALARDLQARQLEGERRLRILQKRAELHF